MIDISALNPSMQFVENLRIFNTAFGMIACVVIAFFLIKPRWAAWNVPTRLGTMALLMLCFSAAYGSFEIAFLKTYFRVPMVTVSLVWATVAALWPREKTHLGSEMK